MTFQKNDYKLFDAYLKAVNNPLSEMKKAFELEFDCLQYYINHAHINHTLSRHVIDLGCGIGRPLIHLSNYFPITHFTGIDNNECNLAIARARVKDMARTNSISLENQDALNLPESYAGKFDLTYSTYNTIGSFAPDEVPKFVSEQSRITKKSGYIINFTWSRSEETTWFLQKYYPSIGLDIVSIDEDKTVLENSIIYRLDTKYISNLYNSSGISDIEIHKHGVWTAVIGRKL